LNSTPYYDSLAEIKTNKDLLNETLFLTIEEVKQSKPPDDD